MNVTAKILMATVFAAGLATAADAKTLIYCSEASPEGFDPALYTAGTTFDAASRTVYNRLVEFKHGSTEVEPGLAESWDISDDGTVYTFHLRPDVKFQTTDFFTPTRTLNADDVIFSFERQLKADNPWNKYVDGAAWEYSDGMGFPDLIKSIEKVDDLTVKFTLNRSGSAVHRRPRHGFRLDRVEGICRQADGRRQRRTSSTRSRSAPGPTPSSPISPTRRSATRRTRTTGRASRRSTIWSSRSPPMLRCARSG